MRIRSVVAAAALTLLLLGGAIPASAAPRALFALADPRLAEVSGLAVGQRNPGLLYVQNDSGDAARFFALDAGTGAVRAECDVPGASNHDWEDLATGPSAAGRPSVWLADIGDNDSQRSQVELYRVDEPGIVGDTCSVGRPDVWRLRYPDGPHDAESLLVDPIRHREYLVTKQLLGRSEVFQVPNTPSTAVQTLATIGTVDFRLTGTPGGPNPVGELTATGASMSADGRLLAIRTYTDAYLWPVVGGDVAAALSHAPSVLALPAQPQGEGIAIDGTRLLTDSEQVGSVVYQVPIPATVLATVLARPTAAPGSTTPGARPSDAATTPPVPARATKPGTAPPAARSSSNRTSTLAVGTTIVVLAGVLAALRARRRR